MNQSEKLKRYLKTDKGRRQVKDFIKRVKQLGPLKLRKLTEKQAAAIRKSGLTRTQLAKKYNVTPRVIRLIQIGETYKSKSNH